MQTQIHILANSSDLLAAAPNYANIARGKASKAKRQRMQAKKQAIENAIINSIDGADKWQQTKLKRAAAAAKQAKISARKKHN